MRKLFDWVRKAIAFISKPWKWLVKFTTDRDFVMMFPLVAFAIGALLVPSVMYFLAFLVWLIPVIKGVNETTE